MRIGLMGTSAEHERVQTTRDGRARRCLRVHEWMSGKGLTGGRWRHGAIAQGRAMESRVRLCLKQLYLLCFSYFRGGG